jgi:hypothetical protein
VDGPDFIIGNSRAVLRSGNEDKFKRLGLNEVLKKDSHSGMKDDISGPLSIIVERFNLPLNSNIR